MKKTITVNYRDASNNAEVNLPNSCPHCGTTMNPDFIFSTSMDNRYDNIRIIGIFLQCTDSSCLNYFTERYRYSSEFKYFRHIENSYRPPIKVELPDNIEKVSPTFVEIYSQATKAEYEGLDQIAGVGYRKSLEFLIKDYAIRNSPDKEESIKKSLLGQVISEYLTVSPKLQNLAKAATWIGNDETHYIRRHDDKDIRDMKQFIKSASQFIAADYHADLAEEFISESSS